MNTDTYLKSHLMPGLFPFPMAEAGINQYQRNGEDTGLFPSVHLSYGVVFDIQEAQTAILQFELDRGQIVSFLEFALWRNTLLPSRTRVYDTDLVLEQAIVSEFGVLSDVAMIYIEKFRSEFIFKIFVRADSYNDELMDLLLEREFDLLEQYSDLLMTFHYLPHTMAASAKGFVSETAKLIFRG